MHAQPFMPLPDDIICKITYMKCCIVAVQVFGQRHYWAERLGPVLCIGLSTIRFRSNEFSVHEVRRGSYTLAIQTAHITVLDEHASNVSHRISHLYAPYRVVLHKAAAM